MCKKRPNKNTLACTSRIYTYYSGKPSLKSANPSGTQLTLPCPSLFKVHLCPRGCKIKSDFSDEIALYLSLCRQLVSAHRRNLRSVVRARGRGTQARCDAELINVTFPVGEGTDRFTFWGQSHMDFGTNVYSQSRGKSRPPQHFKIIEIRSWSQDLYMNLNYYFVSLNKVDSFCFGMFPSH